MIFVTVGTQLPFDRLVKCVDAWAKCNQEQDIFIQSGPTAYEPRHCRWRKFIPQESFDYCLGRAELVVAHAGVGSILSALEFGKPIIVLPRRFEFQEHRNDHQFATAQRFGSIPSVNVAWSTDELTKLLSSTKVTKCEGGVSSSAGETLIGRIREFVHANSDTPTG